MHYNFTIKTVDDKYLKFGCKICNHFIKMKREDLKLLFATTLFHDKCPKCKSPYYDRTPEKKSSKNELLKYGRTIESILKNRGKISDNELTPCIDHLILKKKDKKGVKSLMQPERYFHVIYGMIREVNNGGFSQFFGNSSGRLAFDLIPALEAIKSVKFLSIAKKALLIYGKPESTSDKARYFHIANIEKQSESDPWGKCDNLFYQCNENIDRLLIDFIMENEENF